MMDFNQDQTTKISFKIYNENCINFGLALTTLPVLIGIATINKIQNNLTELGEMSEEIFRGNRLPLLSLNQQNNNQITHEE